MNYNKPEITSLESASLVIQSGGMFKTVPNTPDSSQPTHTPAAYEADE
jgi:hypothetical protein